MMHCVARKQFKVKNSQMFNIPQTRLSCRKNSIFSTQSEVFEKCWKLEYTLIFNYFYFSCYMLSAKTFLKASAELEMKLNVSKYFCYCRLTEGTMLQGLRDCSTTEKVMDSISLTDVSSSSSSHFYCQSVLY